MLARNINGKGKLTQDSHKWQVHMSKEKEKRLFFFSEFCVFPLVILLLLSFKLKLMLLLHLFYTGIVTCLTHHQIDAKKLHLKLAPETNNAVAARTGWVFRIFLILKHLRRSYQSLTTIIININNLKRSKSSLGFFYIRDAQTHWILPFF